MNVFAINGSPKGRSGNTDAMLQPLLHGAAATGAATETVYLNEKQIQHCRGCFHCWTKTPGQCVHRDDMAELLPKLVAAELVIYATPLYCYTMTGLMKDFFDRRLPLATPFIAEVNGRFYHPRRFEPDRPQRTVLLSNCGFPGQYNFSGLIETFQVMTQRQLNGVICCAQGGMLRVPEAGALLSPYFAALERAGRELIETGAIEPATQVILDRPLLDPQSYQQMVNEHWRSTGAPSPPPTGGNHDY